MKKGEFLQPDDKRWNLFNSTSHLKGDARFRRGTPGRDAFDIFAAETVEGEQAFDWAQQEQGRLAEEAQKTGVDGYHAKDVLSEIGALHRSRKRLAREIGLDRSLKYVKALVKRG